MPVARSFFQKIPFIRITSLFLIGILLNHYLDFDLRRTGIVCTILISALIILWHNSNYSTLKIQNLLISAGIIISGVFYPAQVQERKLPSFPRKDYYLAEVCQKPAEKARSFQTILLINNNSLAKPEKVIAYFSKAKFDSTITTGEQLVLLTRPQEIRNSGNPFEFNYQSMMQRKDIWFSVYLAEGTYLKTGHRVNRLMYWAEQIRDNLISTLSSAPIKKEERSVVSALTLGYRAELEPETTDYFASTGAMHVLAVSGLHVGLIYFILGFVLSGIRKMKFGAFIFPALMIILLWSYALITGFSPSVQRATVMFTFIIFGNILRRPVNIYNSLTAAALVLILHHPAVLFEVGFQLSFLAVFGIVLVQPKLAGFIQVKNKFLKSAWDLLTVSIAAQLATFPLGLFYFNQFPNFFWLSNFFVIPGVTLIIWLTFAFFLCSPLPVIPVFIAKLIQWTTGSMLWILKSISDFPHAVSNGIVLGSLQLWIIYAILSSFLIYAFSKRKQWLFLGLIFLIFMQCNLLVINLELVNQKAIYVYNSRNTLIHLINGRTNYLVKNGLDNIPDSDLKMVQKVLDHLKLGQPQIIERNSTNGFQADDLMFKDSSIQFLNCSIKFSKQSNPEDQLPEIITLNVQEKDAYKKVPVSTTLFTGSSYFIGKQDLSIDFKTKLNGAYFLSLN